jgi:hypothetical protein
MSVNDDNAYDNNAYDFENGGNDVENVQESTEKQSMIKGNYTTLTSDEVKRSPAPICAQKSRAQTCFLIYIIVILIVVSTLFIEWIWWMDESRQNESWLKKDIYNGDRRQLTTFPRLYKPKHRKCSDFEYGCCHTYYNCDISDQGELVSDTVTVSPYAIVQHNEHGTNCPRLLDMVSGYNDHYPEEEGQKCAESEFGCCEINYSCDIRMRFSYRNTVNRTKDLWLNDLEKKQTSINLTFAKRDVVGSNCPRLGNIIYEYEGGYPSEISGWWFLVPIGILIEMFIITIKK